VLHGFGAPCFEAHPFDWTGLLGLPLRARPSSRSRVRESGMDPATLTRELATAVEAPVLGGEEVQPYLMDATEAQGLRGEAEAVVLARAPEDVAHTLAWCYEHDVPLTARGGGTGWAGGAVPRGGVVVSLAGLHSIRSIEPLQWRAEVEAGVTTQAVQRLALENGLYYPPDPGAAEESQIGGNVATNAGGPHAFKYGVTGSWVTGLEVAIAPGTLTRFGGSVRKDVAPYDLRSLMIGSEGTLGIVTAVRLKLIPPPEARRPVVALYAGDEAGASAVLSAMASGTAPSAIEFLDAASFAISGAGFPLPLERPDRPFVVIAEADGSEQEAVAGQELLREALSDGAQIVLAPERPDEVAALWRWRDGIGIVARSHLGGKVSEDVCVPCDRLAEMIAATHEAAAAAGLEACCWGHAGDGNVHSTFLFAGGDDDAAGRAVKAAAGVFGAALALGGSVSGEHGIGLVKAGQLARQLDPAALELHRSIKRLLDPKNLLNPGKKV
jgi:glycolate oxidase subunit GlcD